LPFVRYSFHTINLPEIVADINPDNLGSILIAEKIGVKLVGDIEHAGKSLKSYLLTKADYSGHHREAG